MYWNVLWFHLFRDLGEVMDFELDVECSVDPDPEASSSKSSSSSLFPEVCLNTNMLKKKTHWLCVQQIIEKTWLTHFAAYFFLPKVDLLRDSGTPHKMMKIDEAEMA